MWLLLDILIGLAPFAWFASWWFGLKALERDKNWRTRLSIAALSIVTIAAALWFPAGLYASKHSISGNARTIDEFTAVAVLTCGFALILSLFGRPKLIVPIVVTCLGAASWWFGTTIP